MGPGAGEVSQAMDGKGSIRLFAAIDFATRFKTIDYREGSAIPQVKSFSRFPWNQQDHGKYGFEYAFDGTRIAETAGFRVVCGDRCFEGLQAVASDQEFK